QLVTVDQSVLEERIQSGEITEERAKFEPRNKITGYLGINEDIEIQLNTLTARVGDRYIMCSDGLTGGLLDKNNFELAEKIMKGKDIKTACAQLIPLAIKGGSKDNITVVIFDIIDLGIKPPGREWKEESYDDDETLLPGWEDMEE
ncbi:MAG: hypothetical protein L6300_12350, partial [Syntrophaceae bacterium]|nr:hypothetical protein [Syntrophaceae bacterium]